MKEETWFPGEAEPIMELLMKFRMLKDRCFGWKLKEGWRETIHSYKEMYSDLQSYSSIFLGEELTVMWKVHSVCCHLEPFLVKVKQKFNQSGYFFFITWRCLTSS